MRQFYRYIRPQRFNEKRMDLTTMSHGGICLRFEELPEGDLFFTYSRCHKEDFFNKGVARLIADDRATVAKSDPRVLEMLRHLPNSQNTDLLAYAIILKCRKLSTSDEHPLVQRYMQQEYASFADVLEDIYLSNETEARRCASWKKVTADMWKSTYQEHNK